MEWQLVFELSENLLEVRTMLATRVAEWKQHWRLEGEQKGRQEGEAQVLLRLLERRFGSMPPTLSGTASRARNWPIWTNGSCASWMLVASTTSCLESVGSGQVLQLSQAIHPLALIFVSHWRCSSTAVKLRHLQRPKLTRGKGSSRVLYRRRDSIGPLIVGARLIGSVARVNRSAASGDFRFIRSLAKAFINLPRIIAIQTEI